MLEEPRGETAPNAYTSVLNSVGQRGPFKERELGGRALLYKPGLLGRGRGGCSVRAGDNVDRRWAADSDVERVSWGFDRDATRLL